MEFANLKSGLAKEFTQNQAVYECNSPNSKAGTEMEINILNIRFRNSQNLDLGSGVKFTTQRLRDEIHQMQNSFKGWNSPKSSINTIAKCTDEKGTLN
jgi:hypothetical protein